MLTDLCIIGATPRKSVFFPRTAFFLIFQKFLFSLIKNRSKDTNKRAITRLFIVGDINSHFLKKNAK